jgi:hypothetical protein
MCYLTTAEPLPPARIFYPEIALLVVMTCRIRGLKCSPCSHGGDGGENKRKVKIKHAKNEKMMPENGEMTKKSKHLAGRWAKVPDVRLCRVWPRFVSDGVWSSPICNTTPLRNTTSKKAVPLHAMEGLGRRAGIAPTH